MEKLNKKIVYSAVQPTGMLTIGNFCGAIKNWVSLQDEYDCYFSIADLHSLTLCMNGAELRQNIFSVYAMLLACGVDTDKSTFFLQSQVTEHSSLAWILNCYTQYGEAKRMTQFKDKSIKNADNVNVGLFAYPILQAADILLYNAHFVPVGQDQKQHIELTRVIAERFNHRFSPTFNIPDVLIPKTSGKINSLVEPNSKMSKSDQNSNAYILLSDDKDTIVRKIKRAVTDSDDKIALDGGAGIQNLINIYSVFANITPQEVVQQYYTMTYEQFKQRVADIVILGLEPIQQRYTRFLKDKEFLSSLYHKAAEKARLVARKTMSKVNRKIGLVAE